VSPSALAVGVGPACVELDKRFAGLPLAFLVEPCL